MARAELQNLVDFSVGQQRRLHADDVALNRRVAAEQLLETVGNAENDKAHRGAPIGHLLDRIGKSRSRGLVENPVEFVDNQQQVLPG